MEKLIQQPSSSPARKGAGGRQIFGWLLQCWMDQTGGDASLEDSVLCILIWGACREGCGKEQHGEKGIQLGKKKKT